MRAFCAAVSAVKGGSGGRLMACSSQAITAAVLRNIMLHHTGKRDADWEKSVRARGRYFRAVLQPPLRAKGTHQLVARVLHVARAGALDRRAHQRAGGKQRPGEAVARQR